MSSLDRQALRAVGGAYFDVVALTGHRTLFVVAESEGAEVKTR